jgi:hypothetical protein
VSEELKAIELNCKAQQTPDHNAKISLQATACSPDRLLRIILHRVLYLDENSTISVFNHDRYSLFSDPSPCSVRNQIFAVKRISQGYPIGYTSAIAHRLAAVSHQSAPEIAALLTVQLRSQRSEHSRIHSLTPLPVEVLENLSIRANTAGYIEFNFSDPAIAVWLNSLMASRPDSGWPSPQKCQLSSQIRDWNQRLFRLQHSHARCCSLLRLAAHQQWIQLDTRHPDHHLEHWHITNPQPGFWLDSSQQFHTNHPTELQLISRIMTGLDTLVDYCIPGSNADAAPPAIAKGVKPLLAAAEGLNQAFQATHQHWQLMGNLPAQSRDRRDCHLSLILMTQRLLYALMQQQMGIEMPFEL